MLRVTPAKTLVLLVLAGGLCAQTVVLSPKSFGAYGDGMADDTMAIQAAIDALPTDGVLDGEGLQYRVSALRLKSRMTMQRFRLRALGGTRNLMAPVTIDGRTRRGETPKQGIVIRDVHVDGNRANQLEIETPSEEDGGRHCFRVMGRVSNLRIERSSGTYCATDGLLLGGMHDTASDDPDQLPMQNITVTASDFSWNRRDGIAFEGVQNLNIIDTTITNNGVTIGAGGASHGNHCAHVNRTCFASGLWYENDFDAPGGGLDTVNVIGATITGNQTRAVYFYTPANPRRAGVETRRNIRFSNTRLDAGRVPVPGTQLAVQFSTHPANDGLGAAYGDIVFQNCRIEGTLALRGVAGLAVLGGAIETAASHAGFAAYSDALTLANVARGDKTFATHLTPDGGTAVTVRFTRR